ncbi:MAG: (Fe-S)-binding protein [Candidatus Glassbacteria bacterium]|nr:(Fe-S)-binding protein [Candidatus Glassbacteria bacterium]
MARERYQAPELKDFLELPALREGATAHLKPYPASPEHQHALGFPGELVDGWQDAAAAKLGELLGRYRSLEVFLDSCVECGACADKCQFFLGSGDPRNMPVARADLLRRLYRWHFTASGRLAPELVDAAPMSEEMLNDWYVYFHQCSQCRRCSVFCPFGIDTAEISMAAREIMNHIGVGQKYVNEVLGKVHKIGNNLGLPGPALVNTLEELEEEVKESTGVNVRFPLDEAGAEVLLVTPSADFFAEPHVDGLIGYAKVFHQAGIRWTLSNHASEAGNFGMFIGSYTQMRKVAMRIREAALELGVRRIVFGECGHAWRVAYNFLNTLAGPWDFLDPGYPVPQHIFEVTHELIGRGALALDPSANDRMTVTYHDSCNIARASRMGDRPGGQFHIPRQVIKASVNRFVEMNPATTFEKTFCCGGGGGLLTDELMEIRIQGALPRMQALKDVVDNDGVTHMVAVCAICKAQFTGVLPYYDFDPEMIVSGHQLVGNAIRLGTKE